MVTVQFIWWKIKQVIMRFTRLTPACPARWHSYFLSYIRDPHNHDLDMRELVSDASNWFEHGKLCWNCIRQCKITSKFMKMMVCMERQLQWSCRRFLSKLLQTWPEQCGWECFACSISWRHLSIMLHYIEHHVTCHMSRMTRRATNSLSICRLHLGCRIGCHLSLFLACLVWCVNRWLVTHDTWHMTRAKSHSM
jgi:hypothetical protein